MWYLLTRRTYRNLPNHLPITPKSFCTYKYGHVVPSTLHPIPGCFFPPLSDHRLILAKCGGTIMDTYFHQVDLNAFNDCIPGPLPTPADRAKFLKPVVEKREMSGRSIGVELARTIKSAFEAAGAEYGLDSELLCRSSDGGRGGPKRTQEEPSRSTLTEDDLKQGGRSGFRLSILQNVKSLRNKICAFNVDPGSVELEGVSTEDDAASPMVNSAPGVDGHAAYLNNTYEGELGLDQLYESMANVLIHHNQLFAYGLYVQWRWARLFYFDRAGALVSELFDWTETTSLLHDFFWKVAHMTPEQVGYDPTAVVASESDIVKVRSKMQDPSLPAEVQQYVWKAFGCRATQPAEATATNPGQSATAETEPRLGEFPIYRLTVTSSDSSPDEGFTDAPSSPPSSGTSSSGAKAETERAFLVGRPHYADGSLTGRCTQGHIAFDLQEERFCFLKDSWRPLIPGRTRPEHWAYERLQQHNIPGIATLVCGGDVGGHRAQITTVQDAMPPEKRLIPHVHYRIVIKEICLPLTEFRSFSELAGIFRDALCAHLGAWEGAKILHRDVSVGNILIDPTTRRGMLIDWEMSRLASELEDGPVNPDPSGTWRFRSALSVYYPRKPYRLSDDIESFIHAFQYMVLSFHPVDVDVLRVFAYSYFDLSVRIGDATVGGGRKMFLLRSSPWPPFRVIDNPSLQALLDEISSRCHHELYKLFDVDVMKARYGLQGPAAARSTQPRGDSETPELDACDVDQGFLSHQRHLLELFREFADKSCGDKCEDQFEARASEECISTRAVLGHRHPVRTISDASVSSSQSQDDGTEDSVHVPIVTKHGAPAAAASSPRVPPPDPTSLSAQLGKPTDAGGTPPVLPAPAAASAPVTGPSSTSASSDSASLAGVRSIRKRKQEDIQVTDGAKISCNGESPSSSKPQAKRRKQA
ncbi:hypothetical protein LXA43DRAFT_1187614 [Ganoderma leucocontextum]|nr:hypothetical protein LXA43DRAFT_1187614 [Ganoderma leucocontextum]